MFGTANQESEDGEAILLISPCFVVGKKKKSQFYEQSLLLKKFFSKIKSHECRNTNRPFQGDLADISLYLHFFFQILLFGESYRS